MGTGFMFSEFTEDKTRVKISKFDRLMAERLKLIVQKKARFLRPMSVTSWSKHFTKLRTIDGVTKERIEKVIEWYASHIKGMFVPVAYCGETFREKFPKIEDAMKRYYSHHPEVTIDDSGRKAARDPLRRKWPKGTKDQVLPVAQLSINNIIRYKKNLQRKSIFGERRRRIVSLVLRKLKDPIQVVSVWLAQVHKSVATWNEWSGNLMSYVLIPGEDHFQKLLKGWVSEYCGNSDRVDEAMEVLNAD